MKKKEALARKRRIREMIRRLRRQHMGEMSNVIVKAKIKQRRRARGWPDWRLEQKRVRRLSILTQLFREVAERTKLMEP